MTETLLIAGGIALLVAFVGGFLLGRKSTEPTGAPTPSTADAVAADSGRAADEAEDAAKAAAQKKAQEVLDESDAATAARVEQLRARGRAGE